MFTLVCGCVAAPTTPETLATSTYQGCFTDDDSRALPQLISSSNATIESCVAAASAGGFAYAGLQYGSYCFAGNHVGYARVDDTECSMPCSGDADERCGGPWRNSIYAVASRPDAGGSLPVVPGAFGFGMDTRAAYGNEAVKPTIYRVTTLEDSGEGSLRAALEASDPRVVIFEISGTIPLVSPIIIASPYLTVAGQTAPGDGITVRNYGIQINTHDVLLQHFRVRPGGNTCNTGVEAWGGDVFNVVLDHMSVSWGQDETVVFYNGSRPMSSTVWRSIIAEGLDGAGGGLGCGGSPDGTFQSHGMLIYHHTQNVFVGQSLFAHNVERNPYAQGDTTTFITNNLIYDWGDVQATIYGDPTGDGRLLSTLAGNHYRSGPLTEMSSVAYMARARFLASGSQVYMADNVAGGGTVSTFEVINGEGVDPRVGTAPVALPDYAPLDSSATYDVVLANAGARPACRDAVDTRLARDVVDHTGGAIQSQDQVGGWPELSVIYRALSPPSDPHADTNQNGYTDLEDWLHQMAAEVGG